MWKWLKNLFKPKDQTDPHIKQFEDVDYSKLSKGDLKKLRAQGKIVLRDVLAAPGLVHKFVDSCRGEHLWY